MAQRKLHFFAGVEHCVLRTEESLIRHEDDLQALGCCFRRREYLVKRSLVVLLLDDVFHF